MKKNLLVALMCILMLVMFSACGSNEAISDPVPPTQYSASEGNEATSTPVPLPQYTDYGTFESTNFLKSAEDIVISCSDNYVMGNVNWIDGMFWFDLSDKEYESGEYLQLDYDWKIELISNAKIVKVEFYDDTNELIGSEECKNNTVIVDMNYKDVYCNSFMLYIEEGDNLYTAHFLRSDR